MLREVYVRHPPGYRIIVDKRGRINYKYLTRKDPYPRSVMRLLKALYGGMECGRRFYDEFVKHHVDVLGFETSHQDKCLLVKYDPEGNFIKIVFHVDDGMIAQKGDAMFAQYKKDLRARFEYTLGPLVKILGMRVKIDYAQQIVEIDQEDQVEKVLRLFGYDKSNPAKSPIPAGRIPSEIDIPTDPKELQRLRDTFDMYSFVGHIGYLQSCTRPELSFALKILSTRVRSFGQAHIDFAHHVLRWLRGSAKNSLIYRGGLVRKVQIFTDASHAGCPDTRRSITGVIIKLAGNTVFWAALWQKIVSHSSCESELMALDKGATVGQYVSWIVEAMGGPRQGTIDIFVDNRSTIDISSNPVQPGRNLHVHARYFYIRDLVAQEVYRLIHLPSEDQIADIMCTYKGTPNFRKLYALVVRCDMVVLDHEDLPKWDLSLLDGRAK
jgi:hypothetical protein